MAANKIPVQKKPQPIAPAPQEYRVKIPRNRSKTMSIMKFGSSSRCDLTKIKQANIERENNFKEFKSAYNIEDQPKFGAGSEYGREAKVEARRKKYGIVQKRYNSEDQPWILKTGTAPETSIFKGTKEGSISENTSYYVFIQGPEPGSFEAHPVSEWYHFNPVVKYKYLNSDEAEEEFARRNKTLSYFSIMLKKRIKNEEVKADDPEEGKEKAQSGKSSSSLRLTEIEDWTDEDEAEGEGSDNEDGKAPKAKTEKKKKFVPKAKKKKKRPENSDEEAFEESDEGDMDDKEIDYITDTSSSGDEDAGVLEKDKTKYDEKGVEQEEGLRDMNESEESEQEEENKDDKDTNLEKANQDEANSESSGSSSESDPEVTSALFMQKKRRPGSPASSKGGSKPNSRSNTPIPATTSEDKGKKRPADAVGSPVVDVKKVRTDSPKPIVQKRTESPTPT